MSLSITTSAQDTTQCVCVSGEVDVSNAAEMRAAVEAALAEKPERLEVDLAKVPYIDSTGIGVLVGAAHAAAEQNVVFAVCKPQANVSRVLGMLGVEKDLNIEA